MPPSFINSRSTLNFLLMPLNTSSIQYTKISQCHALPSPPCYAAHGTDEDASRDIVHKSSTTQPATTE